MSNNDKFIRDTEFGKLMESNDEDGVCEKCKHDSLGFPICVTSTNFICIGEFGYYFAKDETEEEKKMDSITDFLTAKAKKHEISFPDIPKLKDIIQEYLKQVQNENT